MTRNSLVPPPHGPSGRSVWRALDAAGTAPEIEERAEREFPFLASLAPVDRRGALRVMGASLALAGLTGCDWSADETALPYVRTPPGETLGEPRWYASAASFAGYAQPLVGKTYAGRPVKLEGNPAHPEWRGVTDIFLQAALLGLYDPDRAGAPRQRDRPTGWEDYQRAIAGLAARNDAAMGAGFHLLTGTVTSPTLSRQIDAMLARWPAARWHVTEPCGDETRRRAATMAFGRPLDMHPALDAADVVVSLDDDLLGPGPRQAVNARRWAERRQAWRDGDGGSRLFVAEPAPGPTGAMAEARLPVEPARLVALAGALGAAFGVLPAAPDLSYPERRWVDAAVAALRRHPGRGLVTAGSGTAPEVQALAMILTAWTGGLGTTLRATEPVARTGQGTLSDLAEAAAKGEVTALMVLDANPLYATPASDPFRAAFEQIPLRIHAGLYRNETAALSQWHVPLAHPLESWGDLRSHDGTASVIQPLIQPLHGGRSAVALMGGLLGWPGDDRVMVQETWRTAWGENFDDRWQETLLQGFVAGSAAAELRPTPAAAPTLPVAATDGLTVVARPHPSIWDGRFANNGWLQETPAPLDKVTWGNVIALSPAFAAERGIATGDAVRLTAGGGSVEGPAWIAPGQAERTVAVTLGHGRGIVGQVGADVGYDAFSLMPADGAMHFPLDAIEATGAQLTIATTQKHQAMDGFDFVRTTARGEPLPPEPERASFFGSERQSPSWGMTIDLDACIGCNACLVACVAENNIPVVGPELVAEGREMHWMRVDRYHEGDAAGPRTFFQPVPCMHCQAAPCEMGCPVNAAVHDSEGLNLQVYNRCIGTRTCSSFCPYKVRRFNWFDLTSEDAPEIKAMRNPEVTVRARGVMEKCTYCVQRISAARIAAKIEDRPIADGEVVTACQGACPTHAIAFGDVTDPEAEVSKLKASGRNYPLLPEANTLPSTTYLARVVEPGPEDAT